MERAIIQAHGLTRRFGALTAVNHLDLEVERGEIFGLVGPDGAGKTTTLRLLCGLMDPSEGEAWVAGSDTAREPEAVKDQIGYMAQRFGLYADLTVEENMDFYADLFGITGLGRDQLKRRLLAMTRMEPFRQRQAARLSGGMKQKLALMCTLLHRPQILFLDEPTNGVDPLSRRDFWAILYQLVKDGITIFVTTAYLDEAERCNRIGMMDRGRLIHCDTPEALKGQLEEICYEVEAADRDAARRILRRQPGVVSVEMSGAALHVLVSPSAAPAESLQQALPQARIRRVEPSLEDVFLALVRRARAAEGAV
ncbi:MAG TPA: ABC transporter ATP-binding protein [Bryobacterales bacterium]|jgi:ABC-2 type transport system ATP-binding protein|nr:ABC transporter ATP-binding protein [Bryobacterales bacterium]